MDPFGDWSSLPGKTIATCHDDDAVQLLALVSAVPDGEQMRSFMPAKALLLTLRRADGR